MQYKLIDLDSCIMLRRNPQHMTEKQMLALKKSMRDDGFLAPIVVRAIEDDRHEIISGNHRWLAAKEIGLKTVPAVVTNLTDKQAKRIAVNMNTVHGDPTVELMAPFLADMEDDILSGIHLEKKFLDELFEFDSLLEERMKTLDIPDSLDIQSSTAPLLKKAEYCEACGQVIRH